VWQEERKKSRAPASSSTLLRYPAQCGTKGKKKYEKQRRGRRDELAVHQFPLSIPRMRPGIGDGRKRKEVREEGKEKVARANSTPSATSNPFSTVCARCSEEREQKRKGKKPARDADPSFLNHPAGVLVIGKRKGGAPADKPRFPCFPLRGTCRSDRRKKRKEGNPQLELSRRRAPRSLGRVVGGGGKKAAKRGKKKKRRHHQRRFRRAARPGQEGGRREGKKG